jgi:cation diffusion facilitator CzcD-associated flavoprotein CzcO
MCSGYYDYAAGYTPDFAGVARFKGRIVHPQHWPDDLDHAGQERVVIGSGATAVTLVPELARHRGPRHHAAALADLHGLAAGRGRAAPTGCGPGCRPAWPMA